MAEHFNKLTPAEHERLSLVMEEAGEVIHIIGKIFRHGYESVHPNMSSTATNRILLEKELGDLMASITFLEFKQDVSGKRIQENSIRKYKKYTDCVYLHHQQLLTKKRFINE